MSTQCPRFDRSQLQTLGRVRVQHPEASIQLVRSDELGDRVVLAMPTPLGSSLAGRPLVTVLIPGSGREVLECGGFGDDWQSFSSLAEALSKWVYLRGLVVVLCECEAERAEAA